MAEGSQLCPWSCEGRLFLLCHPSFSPSSFPPSTERHNQLCFGEEDLAAGEQLSVRPECHSPAPSRAFSPSLPLTGELTPNPSIKALCTRKRIDGACPPHTTAPTAPLTPRAERPAGIGSQGITALETTLHSNYWKTVGVGMGISIQRSSGKSRDLLTGAGDGGSSLSVRGWRAGFELHVPS